MTDRTKHLISVVASTQSCEDYSRVLTDLLPDGVLAMRPMLDTTELWGYAEHLHWLTEKLLGDIEALAQAQQDEAAQLRYAFRGPRALLCA